MNSRYEGHCAYFRYIEIEYTCTYQNRYFVWTVEYSQHIQDYSKIVTNWDPGDINSDETRLLYYIRLAFCDTLFFIIFMQVTENIKLKR